MHTQELRTQSAAPAPARLLTLREAKALAPALVQSAQACYDEWDESDVDTYAGGGICHLIADGLVDVLQAAGIDAQTTCSSFEQHVYVICQLAEGVYSLDIPHRLYEIGSMFTWSKIPDVTFDASSLDWFRVDTDPDRFEEYLEH
jgi:hypothetical protein